ncbi:hypothetical protein Pelo_4452 [Pelomyxa schiedti]|nr:hypothetical protein Pelo_4452 [Pelomyxa schiedti]
MYHLRVLYNAQREEVAIPQSATGGDLKCRLHDRFGIPPDSQCLVWGGRVLKEGAELCQVAPSVGDATPIYMSHQQLPTKTAKLAVAVMALKGGRPISRDEIPQLVHDMTSSSPVPSSPGQGPEQIPEALRTAVLSSASIPLNATALRIPSSRGTLPIDRTADIVSYLKETTHLLDVLKERMSDLIVSMESSIPQSAASTVPSSTTPQVNSTQVSQHSKLPPCATVPPQPNIIPPSATIPGAQEISPLLQRTTLLLGVLDSVLCNTPVCNSCCNCGDYVATGPEKPRQQIHPSSHY